MEIINTNVKSIPLIELFFFITFSYISFLFWFWSHLQNNRCNKLVDAKKYLSLADSPPLLSITLKRFTFGAFSPVMSPMMMPHFGAHKKSKFSMYFNYYIFS